MAAKRHRYLPGGEEAWSCSDCGRDVRENDEICPHCNVSFALNEIRPIPEAKEPIAVRTAPGSDAGNGSGDKAPDSESGEKISYGFAFRGQGSDLFLLHLKNVALILVTLGIYSAWAKAALYRFYYGHTELGGSRLRFHGTGKEIFRGLLIAGAVLFAINILNSLAGLLKITSTGLPAFLYFLVLAVGFAYLTQLAVFSSMRYRMGRTTLREIRFVLEGSARDFAKEAMPRLLLAVLTLGICLPLYNHWKTGVLLGNLRYGNLAFGFDAPRDEYWKRALSGFILSVLTLGVYFFFFYPRWIAFKRHHTLVGSSRLECRVQPGEFAALTLTNALLVVFTLGFGAAWAMVRHARFFADRTQVLGSTRLEDALQTDGGVVTSTGDALADGLDADVGLDFGL
jgi:uncharacterized membrane protein YjgN (DUF898 family)